MKKAIVFVWDNFGPIHADRCEAVSEHYRDTREVVGVELNASSSVYDWNSESGIGFKKITISNGGGNESGLPGFFVLLRALFKFFGGSYFFCHYERPSIFICAVLLRLLGQNVYVMNDSKFDDYPRSLILEIVKYIFYMPYKGAISASKRSFDYMRFLGFKESSIKTNYDSMSIDRIRKMSGALPAPMGVEHEGRHFTVIARLVEKKNLFLTLDAYAIYSNAVMSPRRLKIAGSGPLEKDLKVHAQALGVECLVDFMGFVQAQEVSKLLTTSLCLLLLSTEEQFGNVVIEATAMGLPCIVSTACGARDVLVRSGVNGFIVEPENAEGAAYFMRLLCKDKELWMEMSEKSATFSASGDVSGFVASVIELDSGRIK